LSSPDLLIAARIIKGMAAAFTAPSSMSLLTTTFPEGPLRDRAFSIYSVFGASGFSLGLVLSGLLTQLSWRWTLLVSAPAAALVLLGAVTLIPRGEPDSSANRAWHRFDLPGAAVITAAVLLVLAVVTAVVDAAGANTLTSPAATLTAYRPALYLITGIAALGLLAALPGLRRGSAGVPEEATEFPAPEPLAAAPAQAAVRAGGR
jgi:MFS family permease